MKGIIIFLLLSLFNTTFAKECCKPSPISSLYQNFNNLMINGQTELYFTGYAWHNRYTYTKKKIDKYNELAWGGGIGKAIFDKNHNQHSVYAFAFLDSHKDVEPIAGYAFLKTIPFNEQNYLGLGFTVFITARSDLFDNYPFPGLLPWVGIGLNKLTFIATYIPGAKGAGNVLFMLVKWQI